MKKVLVGLAALAGVGLIALVIVIGLASRDIAPPDTSDLIIVPVELAPEVNAYTYFLEAGELLQFPEDGDFGQDYLEGKDTDAEAMSKLIAESKEAIALVERGVQCRACIRPEVTTFDATMPYVGPWRNLGRMMALETRHHRLADRFNESTTACIRLLKFADLIHRDAAAFLDYFRGTSLLQAGLAQARDLTRDSGYPAEERQNLAETLNDLESPAPGLVRVFKLEHQTISDFVARLKNGDFEEMQNLGIEHRRRFWRNKGFSGYLFQPNKTKAISATFFRHAISQVSKPYAEIEPNPLDDEFFNGPISYRRPNAIGKLLCDVLLGIYEPTIENKCMTASDLAATRLIVASHTYRDREGKFPEALQDLVPGDLDAVPVDPYDGKPFRYDATKRIIYSVGKDGQDSGGMSDIPDRGSRWSWGDRRAEPDIVYEVDAMAEASQ